MKKVRRYYDAVAGEIHQIYRSRMREAERALLARHLRGGKILDIGCGGGFHSRTLSPHGSVVGLDISPAMAVEARRSTGGVYIAGEAMRLPFRDGTFDSVVCIFGALNHVKNLGRALKEARRVLKPGGVFIFTVANKWSLPWYWRQARRGRLRAIRRSLGRRGGEVRRSVGSEWYSVYTRFYSMAEVREHLEGLELQEACGLTSGGRVWGFPFSHGCEYLGFVALRPKDSYRRR
ncbi:MAG: class I SAM-dependent methyltransferase [Candidatus Hydrothermarchaeota archaeon]|mgnify:CR=1 FL=1